jgi:hypothetical protein
MPKIDLERFEKRLESLVTYKRIQHLRWAFSQIVGDFYLSKQRQLKVLPILDS